MRAGLSWIAIALACGSPDGGAQPDAGEDAAPERKVPPSFDAGAAPVTGPARLADTGLYADFASRTLAPDIVSYAPRYALWSHGAEKKRYLQLPPGTTIDTSAMDDWSFPIGTKVWKEFDVGGVAIETRLLWKESDAAWWEVAYAWTADGSDAMAAPDGVPNALGTNHDIPSQKDCNACHSEVRDVLIGVSALQLGASDGDGTLATAPRLSDATSKTTFDAPGPGVAKDALGYLHANCGHCHNATSSHRNQSQLRLRLSTLDVDPARRMRSRHRPFS